MAYLTLFNQAIDMDINKLTIGRAKELAALFGKNNAGSDLYARYVGQYVIVRSRNEGINCGRVVMADETGIVLEDARRIWYHKPADKKVAWYEGVAQTGVSSDSKMSVSVQEKAIIEDYSVTVCSAQAEESLKSHKAHVQS